MWRISKSQRKKRKEKYREKNGNNSRWIKWSSSRNEVVELMREIIEDLELCKFDGEN